MRGLKFGIFKLFLSYPSVSFSFLITILLFFISICIAQPHYDKTPGKLSMLSNPVVVTSNTTSQRAYGHNSDLEISANDLLTTEEIPTFSVPEDDLNYDIAHEQWITVRMKVTAYCPCRKCCGKFSDGRTASNHKIRWGDRFAAADRKFSFGTEMIIPGYNNSQSVKVLDRGRVIKNNNLDVFFNRHSDAQEWGVKYLDVQIRVR